MCTPQFSSLYSESHVDNLVSYVHAVTAINVVVPEDKLSSDINGCVSVSTGP